MSPLVRHLTLLGCLLPGCAFAATDDEVQELPPFAVPYAAGTQSLQPSLLTPPALPDFSTGFADAARYSAGFSINDAGARGFGQITTLRGLGNTPFFSDSSSPVYLDDIPLGNAATFPSGLYSFSQVAIHRGPQANTLFGRAGDAGVIQLTGTPTPGGSLRAAAGNHGLFSFGGAIQTATDGPSDISASVSGSRRDGYIHNTQLNQDVDSRDSLAGRVKWRYRPAEDLELSLHALGQRSRDGAQALVPLGGPYYTVQRGKEGESDTDFGAAALGVSRKLADGVLSSATSFSRWELAPYSNRLVVFGGADFDSVMSQSQRNFAEELRYVSADWSGGAFYNESRTRGTTDRIFSTFPIERSSFTTEAKTLALFGRANLAFGGGWRLTPGLRGEWTKKDFTRIETIPASTTIERDADWTALLPSLALSHAVGQDGDASLTVSRGFKPGGYSAFTGRADLTEFDAQRNWTVEAAYTHAPKNSPLNATVRAYAARVRGYQIERSFAVPNSFTDEYLVANAEEARLLGLEIESVWRPAADWRVTLAASFTRATLEDFTDPFTGSNYSGSQVPFAPAGNGALRVEYRPATGFFAGAGITWTGTTYYDEQESAMFRQRSYSLIEADAGYAFARGEVRVFGRNLGDEEYYSSITPGVGHATPGAPLTWGGELVFRW